jgi:pimeloyl-ACP methyl ester carboxylesterase
MLGERYAAIPGDERARWRRDAGVFLAEERSVRTGDAPYDVAGIRAPLVYGRSDPAVMAPVVEYLERRVPNMQVITIPGAGHHAHRTAPEEFAQLVRRGLAVATPAT